ncbi:hypothetical protein PGT21_025283 [Puccinia graminis f. sp. tritici]|uniref:Uncharacterized protein n=1 Tax=Puccinia graminis f. sp. tritici TaxID=56615 RepID=A0A5B0S4V6_PUCGR|nr:hypothetical protein PGT21_025283 [Puccinia graminis f. sp. tritici]KAA1131724.1 hypothetical protein PGTUg99_017496 [Puccinia graminis f. sp. tritici]
MVLNDITQAGHFPPINSIRKTINFQMLMAGSTEPNPPCEFALHEIAKSLIPVIKLS